MSKGLSGIFYALEFLVVLAVEGVNGWGYKVVDAGRGPGNLLWLWWQLVNKGFQMLGRWQLLMVGGRVVFHQRYKYYKTKIEFFQQVDQWVYTVYILSKINNSLCSFSYPPSSFSPLPLPSKIFHLHPLFCFLICTSNLCHRCRISLRILTLIASKNQLYLFSLISNDFLQHKLDFELCL